MKQQENLLKESMNISSVRKYKNMEDKIKVIISTELIGNVTYLHNKYKNVEWSGYLYFEQLGNIENPSDLVLIVKDFVLLDVGTAASTYIKPTPEQVIQMFDNRPQIIEKQLRQGLLHTHHSMSVFFSGIDTDTLLEETNNTDYFLSVIVNNKGDIIAKVAQKTEITSSYKYKFSRNLITTLPKTEECILVYDCDIIIKPNNSFMEDCILVDKVLEERKKVQQSLITESKNYSNRHFLNDSKQTNLFTDVQRLEPDDDNEYVLKDLTIREKVELFTKACMIISDDLEIVNSYTYQQCKEEFEECYKNIPEGEKYYEEELKDSIYDIFVTIFQTPSLVELNDIIKLFNIYLKDGVVERIITRVSYNFFEDIKEELKMFKSNGRK